MLACGQNGTGSEMPAKVKTIENLVFEGGGVRGIAYAGALKVLEGRGLLSGVRGVAGTSAGAFMALLLSLDYTPDEIAEILKSLDFRSLEDRPNPLRVASHYGFYKGDVLYDWIASQLIEKGLPETLTFEALATEAARDLRVFATDLNIRDTREFSAATTPKASVAGAIRASMSIPLMYSAWQFPDGIPDSHIYVDGGTVYNYPINAFDTENTVNPRTLGFHFVRSQNNKRSKDLGTGSFLTYAQSLFATVLSAQEIDFRQDPEQMQRTVGIDDHGYHATDLSLPPEGFEKLYGAGAQAITERLNMA